MVRVLVSAVVMFPKLLLHIVSLHPVIKLVIREAVVKPNQVMLRERCSGVASHPGGTT